MAKPVRIAILANAAQARKELDSFGKDASKIGQTLRTGLAVGLGAVTAGLAKTFVDGAKAAESYLALQRKTAAVIKSTGNAARISVKGVTALAGELESMSGIDEDLIVNSQNVLATFTNVRNGVKASDKIFNRATRDIVDMSAALGTDMQGAAIQVGKALNDPVKGITALSRVGVSFTAQQKQQIAALVASGKTMDAQRIILAELEKEFGGAAKAAGGTGFSGALNRAKDAFGDLARDLATDALPTLTRVAEWFSQKAIPAIGKFVETIKTNIIPAIKTAFKQVSEKLPPIDIGKAFKATAKQATAWAQPIIDAFEIGTRTGDFGPLGRTIGTKLGEAIGTSLSKIKEAAGKVDWLKLGEDVGKTALPFAIGFLNTLFEPLFDGQFWKEHWGAVLGAAVAFIPIGKGASFGVRVAEKLGLSGGIVGGILKGIQGSIGALGGAIVRGIGSLGKHFVQGFASVFPEASRAVSGFVGRLGKGLSGGWVSSAKSAAISGITAFARSAGTAVGNVVAAAGRWGAKIADRIYFGIKSNAGKFGSVLRQAGQQVIDSLLQGLQDNWHKVTDWLDWATTKIPFHKGPPARDATLLLKSGRLIMTGFLTGLQSKYGKVKGSLRTFTGALAKEVATKLTALADQRKQVVANLIQAKNDLAVAVRDSMRGGGVTQLVDFSQYASTARADAVVRALRDRLTAIRSYAAGVKTLAARGIGTSLTKQLLEAGLDGSAVVDALRSASPSIIKELAALDRRISKESAAYGTQLSGLVYNGSIAAAQRAAAAPAVLEIRSSGSKVDDLLLELLRGAIRKRGGNVQLVLGRR